MQIYRRYRCWRNLLQAVDRDGTFLGLDFETYEKISNSVNIPVIISGGCNGHKDIKLI